MTWKRRSRLGESQPTRFPVASILSIHRSTVCNFASVCMFHMWYVAILAKGWPKLYHNNPILPKFQEFPGQLGVIQIFYNDWSFLHQTNFQRTTKILHKTSRKCTLSMSLGRGRHFPLIKLANEQWRQVTRRYTDLTTERDMCHFVTYQWETQPRIQITVYHWWKMLNFFNLVE